MPDVATEHAIPEAAAPTRSTQGHIVDAATIVAPRKLARALEEAHASSSDSALARTAVLKALKDVLEAGRAEIRRRFEASHDGDACVAESAHLFDRLVAALADLAVDQVYPAPNPTLGERFAIAATGGYGRGELAPFSDLDLLFLLPYKRSPRVEQVVEYMLYLLWDLGLKVGHAVRSVDESIRHAKADITIRTALLECRPLWGERKLLAELRRRFAKEVAAGTGPAFVEAKLAERDERHRRLGDSRYVLEPNIKEGKGGLRDLQTLFWIGKYLHQVDDVSDLVDKGGLTRAEAARFAKDLKFLRTLRCHLHYLTGRAEDRLTFETQAEIGRRLGYTDHAGTSGVERFMKHYFLVAKDVGDLTRIFCAALEAESQRRPRLALFLRGEARRRLDGFLLDGERLTIATETQFRNDPVDMIRMFRVAQKAGLDIHPHALKLITRSLGQVSKLRRDGRANALFLEILTAKEDPEIALRRMSEAGILGRFVPDFGRVVAQMQYDMYHVYTVDEHTLFALGILHRVETGEATHLPLAAQVVRKVQSRRALYLALLCHDIAKGRGGDHSVLGAKVVAKLGPRLGLDAEETETAVWLVRWHLLMSNTALKRDIEDDKTVRDFCATVESVERLRLLLVLTTCDISAVGPGRWTAWKATLLSHLFTRSEELLTGGLTAEGRDSRVRAAQAATRALLTDWSDEDADAFMAKGYPPYWLAFDAETHVRHARLVREAERSGAPLLVDTRIDRDRTVTEVTILAADHPGLFSRLAGAMAVSGANIVDAKIATLANGMALDVFSVQDATEGGALVEPTKLARLSSAIERSLTGELKTGAELAAKRPAYPSRTRMFPVQPRVLIDNEASATHTVIEVNGRDRPGLLHDITRALTRLGLQISSAKVSTFGERAIDVFYVKDVFGLKVSHDAKLKQVRDQLREVLVEADPPAGRERGRA